MSIASIGLIGGIFGSAIGGIECESLGRKTCILMENIVAFCSLLLIGLSQDFNLILLGRFTLGYSMGSICGVVPIYTSEICQPKIRNFTGTLYTVVLVTSISLVYIVGACMHWRYMVVGCSFAPLTCIFLSTFLPESPNYYTVRGDLNNSFATLLNLRGDEEVATKEFLRISENLSELKEKQAKSGTTSTWSQIKDLRKQPTFMRPFLSLFVIVGGGWNITGLTGFAFYLTTVLMHAKIPEPYLMAVCLSTYRGILTAAFSFFVPKFKRKFLYVGTCVIMSIGAYGFAGSLMIDLRESLGEVASWIPIIGTAIFYTGFALGNGQILGCFQGELLPASGRGIGSAALGLVDSSVQFVVIKSLPAIEESLGLGFIFACFGTGCLIMAAFVQVFIPETRGKTLEEIEDHYRSICHQQKH